MPGIDARLWTAVMSRAGYRCERVIVKRGHPSTQCTAEHAPPSVILVVAPRDPAVPEVSAWRTPTEDLAAWCSPCLSDARRRSVAAKRRRRVIPGQLDLLAETGSAMSDVSGTTDLLTSDSAGVMHGE
jgi:hypothetical protein